MQTQSLSLTLHPGGSKSGSTYLQSFCLKNDDRLRQQGLLYWHGFRELPFVDLADGPDDGSFRTRLLSGIEGGLTGGGADKVLLSYENVFGEPLKAEGLYSQAPEIARQTAPMLAEFRAPKVIFVIRRLDEFLLSQFNQRKKQGAKMTFEGFSDLSARRNYSMRNIIEALRIYSEVAEIIIIEFDELRERPRRFCGDFLAECGVKIDRRFSFDSVNTNPSVNADGIKLLQYAKEFLSHGDYMELRKFVQARMPKKGYDADERRFLERWSGIADQDYAEFMRETAQFARIIVWREKAAG